MNDKKILISLKNGQKAYEKIVGQKIHYVYFKDNKYQEIIFIPKKQNFMHLCGIHYHDPKSGDKVSATKFYDLLRENKINIKGIVKKQPAEQKLQVIHQLNDLTTCNLRIIDKQTIYLKLVFERAIRSRRQVFALTLTSKSDTDHYVPCSLLNLKTGQKGKHIDKGHAVHCIYSVDVHTKDIQILCRTDEFNRYDEANAYPYGEEAYVFVK